MPSARSTSSEKLAKLLDTCVLNIVTAVRLSSGIRLLPASIEAIRGAVEPVLKAARALGALHPGYHSDVVETEDDEETVGDTRLGFRTSKRTKPPPANGR